MDRFIVNPIGTTAIEALDVNTLVQSTLSLSGGGNALATNNVDGITLGYDSGTTIAYWDPVSGATGTFSISGVENFADDMDATGAGTFDNDRAQLIMLGDSGGTTEATMWYYRISFEPYVTGAAPVVKTLDQIRLYTDNALATNFTSSLGDVAWDSASKKLYISTTAGEILYFYPYDMRWNTAGLACQVFSQGTPVAFGIQTTFTADGSIYYAYETGGTEIYTIDRVPGTATATLIGDATGGIAGAIDLAEWPCTQPL